jgi:uncharacterized protein (TIGR03083 family)
MMVDGAPIDHGRFLNAIGHEAEILVAVARSAPPGAPVPTCPGWTVDEVVRHVGSVYRAVRAWLSEGQRPREWQRVPEPGHTVEEYLREGLTELVAAVTRHLPSDPAATWWPGDRSYGFWCRRMAHETTVHRVDVQQAAGREVSDIADDLAVDGVDEALSLWFGHKLSVLGLSGTRAATVALCTGGHHWIARAGPGDTVARRCTEAETAVAEAVVTGAPAAVYLWLWGRQQPGAVTVDGDDDAVGQLWALMRLATR